MALRVGFAGTPRFAVVALRAIVEAGFTVPVVLTRADKPKGRGLRLAPSEVADEAARTGLAVAKPITLKSGAAKTQLVEHDLDALVVAAYGLILPQGVLQTPRHGCLNLHASLLPRWRGAAPIARAIEAGDPETGVTIMQMDAGLDTGPVVAARRVAIDARETSASLHDKLAATGATLIVETLRRLERAGRLSAEPQPTAGVTYAAKIGREEARIDWRREAVAIDRQVRAFNPVPGAYTHAASTLLKIERAEPLPLAGRAPLGTVVAANAEGIDVACGEGALRILELKPAGGRRMSANDAIAGRIVAIGARFA